MEIFPLICVKNITPMFMLLTIAINNKTSKDEKFLHRIHFSNHKR